MVKDESISACLRDEIAAFIQSYSDEDFSRKQNLQQMVVCDPRSFVPAAVQVLGATAVCPGWRYVAQILPKDRTLVEALDTPLVSLGQATDIARLMGLTLEAALETELSLLVRSGLIDDERVLRLLAIVEAAGAERRCLPYQNELLHPATNPSVRSKAAKLLTIASRRATLAAKLLLDPDPRVQASAVEALWTFDEEEATPIMIAASRAKNHRVVGNAAIGLYRLNNLVSLRIIWGMVRHPDPQTRIAGVWVMGETGDPRFLLYLEELSRDGNGVPKPVSLRALRRIREKQSEIVTKGDIQIRIHRASVDQENRRRIQFALGPATLDFHALNPLSFSLTEGGKPVSDYEVTPKANPAYISSSFIVPRILSMIDPLRMAIQAGMEGCLAFKRPNDSWRVDRYAVEGRISRDWLQKGTPYDDTIPMARLHRGFFMEPAFIPHIIENPGPKERAAMDLPPAVDRALEAIAGQSGAHHMFVFLADNCLDKPPSTRWVRGLAEVFEEARVHLHVFHPAGVECYELMEAFHLVPGCKVHECTIEDLPGQVELVAATMLNNFEISYVGAGEPQPGALSISGSCGYGVAEFLAA